VTRIDFYILKVGSDKTRLSLAQLVAQKALNQKKSVHIQQQESLASVKTDVLINLTDEVLANFSCFERLVECLCLDDDVKELGRERYRYYAERGYPIHMHEIE
jgi:DNA polymerase IIIc chi subunit